jgi:hypothetical protein
MSLININEVSNNNSKSSADSTNRSIRATKREVVRDERGKSVLFNEVGHSWNGDKLITKPVRESLLRIGEGDYQPVSVNGMAAIFECEALAKGQERMVALDRMIEADGGWGTERVRSRAISIGMKAHWARYRAEHPKPVRGAGVIGRKPKATACRACGAVCESARGALAHCRVPRKVSALSLAQKIIAGCEVAA